MATERPARGKAFERLFQAVTRRWVAGDVDAGDAESWLAFRARVERGLSRLVDDAAGPGRTVAAFTSAGAIGAVLGHALGLGDEKSLEIGWVVKNASLTELLFSGGRVTLSSFNGLPHLPDPAQHSYR